MLYVPFVFLVKLLCSPPLCPDHLLVSVATVRELLDLCTGHGEPWVLLEVSDVVVVEVVLEQGASPMDVETYALKHWALLQLGEAQIL